jgi:hypothetical protein
MKFHGWSTAGAALVLASAAVAVGSGIRAVQAAPDPAVDFIVTPSRVEMRAQPGERLDAAITVYNRDDDVLVLDAYIDDIEFPRNELVELDDLAFTASRWLEFRSDQLTVDPGADAQIWISATVPADTPIGGYHAFGFLQSRPPEGLAEIQPSGRIGITVLVEVAPSGSAVDRAARVSDGGLEVNWKNPFDPEVIARTVVDNTGDAHVVTGGVHTFRSWPGSGSEEAKFGPDTTLRGTRHTFESRWDAVPLFGKVTVTSELVYQVGPDELPVIVTQHTVWIIPWHLVVVGLAVLAVAWFVRQLFKSNRADPPEDTETHEEERELELQTQ